MEHLENAAFISVGRACGFGGLAIFCVVVGLSPDPILAARAGGLLTLLMTLILLIKSWHVQFQDYRKTELWNMLDELERPPAAYARRVSTAVLRETYLWFARCITVISIIFWSTAILFSLTGVTAYDSPFLQNREGGTAHSGQPDAPPAPAYMSRPGS